MKIKRYFASDMRQAIREVREEQGPDAVILSNRRVEGGVEIVAAVDFDEAMFDEPRRRGEGTVADGATSFDETASREPAARPEVIWSQEPAILEMRNEMKTLRGLLETQLTGFAWGALAREKPIRTRLLQKMTELGLSPALSQEIAEAIDEGPDFDQNLRLALGMLAHKIPVASDNILNHGGVVALIGPTGVGKTTTVAKLAARFTLRHGPNRVALITTDSYRIGAHAQLRTYGRILGVPVRVAGDADELRAALKEFRDKQLVLIDTAGASQRDVRLTEQFTMLRDGAPLVKNYLVLSANTYRTGLEEVVKAFGRVELDGCIVTKVDETTTLGGVLSTVIQHHLPVAYISDGQRVPEDMHPARAHSLVSRSVALLTRTPDPADEHALASTFGGLVANAHG